LELIGPLVAVCTSPELNPQGPMRIWVDNAGSVRIWQKGYSSSCALCTTLVKAIATVAAGVRCRVGIEKITRCSNKDALYADMLSKAQFRQFRATSGDRFHKNPAGCPELC
jgi:hypothetical protein